METVTRDMVVLRQTVKFYELCLEEIRRKHGLTKLEIVVIGFLANDPEKDSVAEIAEERMLSRGNVSRGADSLCRRGFLERVPDTLDRRLVHLRLLPAAEPILREVWGAMESFQTQLFKGFTPEEKRAFDHLREKIADNIVQGQERGAMRHG